MVTIMTKMKPTFAKCTNGKAISKVPLLLLYVLCPLYNVQVSRGLFYFK